MASTAPANYHIATDAERLGSLLREARNAAGLKLKQVATRAGTSETTLSLLERGQRLVNGDLLERIVRITGADTAEVFRFAQVIPPQAAADVLGAELAGVLSSSGLSRSARRALRRVHLAELAARIEPKGPMPPVDLVWMLDTYFGIDVRAVAGIEWARFATPELVEYSSELDGAGQRQHRNLVLGHMVGHAALAADAQRRPLCEHAAAGTGEAEATWIAGLVLMPRAMLDSEAQLMAGTYKLDDPDGLGSFISEVADAFAAPSWLAARHLGDAGLLAWAAGLEDA
jgi:transcriptional regulator with XRE-family HTH domain